MRLSGGLARSTERKAKARKHPYSRCKQRELSPHAARCVLHDSQPKPATGFTRALSPEERLAGADQIVRRHAGAVVLDVDAQPIAFALHTNIHLAAWRRVPDGVVHQVA